MCQLFWPPFRGHLYSGDTCLSPEGVPRREVPLYPKDLREAELYYQRPKTTIVTQRSANFKIFIHHSGDLTRISRLTTQFALLSLQAESLLVYADPASPYECWQFWNYSKIKLSLKENLIGSNSPLLKQKYRVTRPSLNRTAAKESVIYIIWFPWFSSTPFERDCWKGVTLCFCFLSCLCKKMHHWLVGKLNLFSPRNACFTVRWDISLMVSEISLKYIHHWLKHMSLEMHCVVRLFRKPSPSRICVADGKYV